MNVSHYLSLDRNTDFVYPCYENEIDNAASWHSIEDRYQSASLHDWIGIDTRSTCIARFDNSHFDGEEDKFVTVSREKDAGMVRSGVQPCPVDCWCDGSNWETGTSTWLCFAAGLHMSPRDLGHGCAATRPTSIGGPPILSPWGASSAALNYAGDLSEGCAKSEPEVQSLSTSFIIEGDHDGTAKREHGSERNNARTDVAEQADGGRSGIAGSASCVRRCHDCELVFSRAADLETHARDEKHQPYLCPHEHCEKRFSRRDAVTRHEEVRHRTAASFECTVTGCQKYRGSAAFKRRDHLLQHMRKVHCLSPQVRTLVPQYCDHKLCSFSGSFDGFEGFTKRRDYAAHKREVHVEGTFDCDVSDCARTGRQGFARKKDLELHLKRVHQVDEPLAEMKLSR